MTVLVAPDSFKGTYTSVEVADAIATGIASAGGQAIRMPVADGGEGTLDCLRAPLDLALVSTNSRNPWGSPMRGHYGISSDGTAVIEVAEVSGITTFHDGPRDPITASTYGTGMLMVDAMRRGARHIVVGAGGSASTDGGQGAIAAIQASGLTPQRVTVLTDVTIRFADAARVFGPQKGADNGAVQRLTDRLHELAERYPRDPRTVPGGGAAGGFAGGMWSVFEAMIVPGADFILDSCGFDSAAARASAIVVGEGRLDSQTSAGKIISAIVRRAGTKPLFAVVGSLGDYTGEEFTEIRIATDIDAMRRAGAAITSLTVPFAHRSSS